MMNEWDGSMYSTYKNFLYSSDIFEVVEWANAIRNQDLEAFVRLYEPFRQDDNMFDPVELAIAYDAEDIYEYLITTFDYTDFKNAVDFSLLVILLVFEREHFLLTALDTFSFSNEHLLEMYAYMIDHNDEEYFKQFYSKYPIGRAYRLDLLRFSLNNYEIFLYLIELDEMRPMLKEEGVVYDILSYHPRLIHLIRDIKNLEYLIDTDLFQNILSFEEEVAFETVLDFLLKRGWNVNMENGFGLSLYHMALRFAAKPEYVETLIEKGAKTKRKTAAGYPPSHQLLFRDARFTLDLSHHIDFNARDKYGLTLQDYDLMQRSTNPDYEEILSVVRVALNMDETSFYELSEEEFYNITLLYDIEVFTPYLTLLSFTDRSTRDLFQRELQEKDIEVFDVMTLKEMFPETFKHDTYKTLQVGIDFYALGADKIALLQKMAKDKNTTVVLQTEDYVLNKAAHIEFTFHPDGTLHKEARVHTHLVDLYYLHYYYDIPLENIEYDPVVKRSHRFLN